jgi:hypothetical protein
MIYSQNLIKFVKIFMHESLKFFFLFFFKKKTVVFWKFLKDLTANPNRVPLSEMFENMNTLV